MRKHTSSLDTPAVTGVYPTFGPKTKPKLLWRVKEDSHWPNIPLVTGGMLIAGPNGGSLVGLDAAAGTVRWRWKSVERDFFCGKCCDGVYPRLAEGRLLYFARNGALLSLDPRSGTKHWVHLFQSATASVGDCQAHVAGDSVLVVTTWRDTKSGIPEDLGYRLSVFDRRTGKRRWERRLRIELQQVVLEEHVYVLLERKNQVQLLMLDRTSGKELRRFPVGTVGKRHRWLAWARDGVVALCDERPKARLFAVATGKVVSGVSRYCGRHVDGLVVRIEGSRSRLTVRDANTGAIRWKRERTYLNSSGYTVADGIIYLGSATRVRALDLRTGRTRWVYTVPRSLRRGNTWLTSPPVPSAGALYFTTKDDYVWALR